MYKNYKVVVNTASGRRRYMQYLIPYIVACKCVDRYDIWVNTNNGADIEFFRQIADKYPVVNLVWQPDGVVNGNASINAFYKACVEPDTIYFKLDDDIIWMETDLIERMVKFRIDNPECFLVSPLVINNSLSTYLLQVEGKLKLDQYYNADSSHTVLWESGHFAYELHTWFINNYLKNQRWTDLYLGKKLMGMTRFSINAILWFGEEMAKFSGIVPGDDEEFMSCIYPTKKGMANAWNGDAIVAHFAFYTQREQLDKENILGKYGQICHQQWQSNPIYATIDNDIQIIMSDIAERESDLLSKPSPYKIVERKKSLKSKIKKHIPVSILKLRDVFRDQDNAVNHIL